MNKKVYFLKDLEEGTIDAVIIATTSTLEEVENAIDEAKELDDYTWEDLIESLPDDLLLGGLNMRYDYLYKDFKGIDKYDFKKLDKIVNGLNDGWIIKDNFWDSIRWFCKNVKSERSISRWQIIADYVYERI